MGYTVKINIRINPDLIEPFAEIHTRELTVEIQEMIERINHKTVLTAVKDQKIYILNPAEVVCFFTESQRVMARTASETFALKLKLYELEQMLGETSFVRISNSVIANVNYIKNISIAFNGTLDVKFKDGSTEFVSRRYVSKIKDYLGLGGNQK